MEPNPPARTRTLRLYIQISWNQLEDRVRILFRNMRKKTLRGIQGCLFFTLAFSGVGVGIGGLGDMGKGLGYGGGRR
jgi:hypothetical protein